MTTSIGSATITVGTGSPVAGVITTTAANTVLTFTGAITANAVRNTNFDIKINSPVIGMAAASYPILF